MALEAHRRGIAGLVVWGAVRDADALEELRFPVLALGTCPLSPAKQAAPSVGEEAAVAGVRVVPCDLVVADRDGMRSSARPTAPRWWAP